MLRYAALTRPTRRQPVGGLAVAALTAFAVSLFHDLEATIMILMWNLGTAAMIAGSGASSVAARSAGARRGSHADRVAGVTEPHRQRYRKEPLMDQRVRPSARPQAAPAGPFSRAERAVRSDAEEPRLRAEQHPDHAAQAQDGEGVRADDGRGLGPVGKVDRGFKRLIAHVASRAAGCQYCMAHTAGGALHFGVEDEKLAAVWEYQTSPSVQRGRARGARCRRRGASVPNAVTDEMFADAKALDRRPDR